MAAIPYNASGEYPRESIIRLGYIIDSEFDMYREPLAEPCEDTAKLREWQIGNGFETRWDLGVP